jgi:hypothetical protein
VLVSACRLTSEAADSRIDRAVAAITKGESGSPVMHEQHRDGDARERRVAAGDRKSRDSVRQDVVGLGSSGDNHPSAASFGSAAATKSLPTLAERTGVPTVIGVPRPAVRLRRSKTSERSCALSSTGAPSRSRHSRLTSSPMPCTRPGGVFFALAGMPALVGHSGSTGVWAYYAKDWDAVLVGAVSDSSWQERHVQFLLGELVPVLARVPLTVPVDAH